MLVALSLWAIISPLSTYNTFAMFGIVKSQWVPVQLAVTAVMIGFAMVAGSYFGKHCLQNASLTKAGRRAWVFGFYVIGPPVLYSYYRLHCYKPVETLS